MHTLLSRVKDDKKYHNDFRILRRCSQNTMFSWNASLTQKENARILQMCFFEN